MSTQRAMRKITHRRRIQTKWRDKWVRIRTRCAYLVDKHEYDAIRVRMSRSVIGEPYDHARRTEALLTFRFRDPIIVPLDRLLVRLERATRGNNKMAQQEESLWASLRSLGRQWRRERAPVRHPIWREPDVREVR